MKITLDDNARIGSYGIAEINGHRVAFGAMPDGYQSKCLACEMEYTRGDDYFQLSGLDAQNFQLYSFYMFVENECPEDYDTISGIISDKVVNDYIGTAANKSNIVNMENEIADLLGHEVSVTDTVSATTTFKSS